MQLIYMFHVRNNQTQKILKPLTRIYSLQTVTSTQMLNVEIHSVNSPGVGKTQENQRLSPFRITVSEPGMHTQHLNTRSAGFGYEIKAVTTQKPRKIQKCMLELPKYFHD